MEQLMASGSVWDRLGGAARPARAVAGWKAPAEAELCRGAALGTDRSSPAWGWGRRAEWSQFGGPKGPSSPQGASATSRASQSPGPAPSAEQPGPCLCLLLKSIPAPSSFGHLQASLFPILHPHCSASLSPNPPSSCSASLSPAPVLRPQQPSSPLFLPSSSPSHPAQSMAWPCCPHAPMSPCPQLRPGTPHPTSATSTGGGLSGHHGPRVPAASPCPLTEGAGLEEGSAGALSPWSNHTFKLLQLP